MNSEDTYRILNFASDVLPDMEEFLKKLVSMESPTDNPESQQPIFDCLTNELEALNFRVKKVSGKERGGFIYAVPNDRIIGEPFQLIIGHCDTVWPINTLADMPIESQNGKLAGPGIFDMKAGLTQIIYSLKAIRKLDLKLKYTPIILINSDEEKGSRESGNMIRCLSKISSRAFILEPPLGPSGKLKTARKGLGRFTITVIGKSAHAGLEPGKGASAILELSHQIQALFKLNDPEKGITVNVGMIEGGLSANVVAPIASAVVDVRVLRVQDGERITREIKSLKAINPKTEIKVEGSIGRPPMERTERNRRIWISAQNMAARMGLTIEEATAGGGSDGNTTSQFTATLDGLGTVGEGAHARHEHIQLEKLAERTALLTHLLLMV